MLPLPVPRPSPRSRRLVLRGAASLAALVIAASLAGAQDTTSVPKPPTPVPAIPTVPARDTSAAPRPASKDSTAGVPARDSTALGQPAVPAAIPAATAAPVAGTARDSAATAAAAGPLVAPPSITLNVAAPSAAGSAAAGADSRDSLVVAAPTAPGTSLTVLPSGSATPAAEPSDLANAFVQRAVSLYEQGKHEAALSEYRKGIAHDPMDSDTWYGLAELLNDLGRSKQAAETYALALETIVHAPELRVPFAELLMKSGRRAEAIKVLQRGIELDPDAAEEMKSLLGNVLVGVLDDSTEPAGAPAASTVAGDAAGAAAAPKTVGARPSAARPKPKLDRKKRKKLCNLFCPGTFTPIAPKPR